jgi:hypothetical protein
LGTVLADHGAEQAAYEHRNTQKLDQWICNMVRQPLLAFDTRYDAFVSVTFPKARHRLHKKANL